MVAYDDFQMNLNLVNIYLLCLICEIVDPKAHGIQALFGNGITLQA